MQKSIPGRLKHKAGTNTFICSRVCTNTVFAACSAHLAILKTCTLPLLFVPQYLLLDWGMTSTKNTTEKEILTHKVTILLHRCFLCQMQLVQVCHHVSHLPCQWPRTGKSYAGKSPRSLFQEGPLMLHVERPDGICSKPQLDHPEKMPLLSQPLSFNTCMGSPKSP